MAGLFGNKVLFAAYKVKFCGVARLRTDVLFVFPFNALIYQWAVRLTTILSAELGYVILPYLAAGYGTTEIAYAIGECNSAPISSYHI